MQAGALGSVRPLRHAALHLQHFGPSVKFVVFWAALYVLEEQETVRFMLNQTRWTKVKAWLFQTGTDTRTVKLTVLVSTVFQTAPKQASCVGNTDINSIFKGLLLFLQEMDTAAPMISSDKMAAAIFQLPAVFPSASVGSDPAGHTLHCGAGSDRMIQVNNGRKAFF